MTETGSESMFGVEGMTRSIIIGAVVGALITFVVTGGITLWVTDQFWPSFGVGAFAAFWGGPGFGGMLGAVSASSRAEHEMA
jgi:hypothetical protein